MDDKIRLRVEYSDNRVFYIISTTNANNTASWAQKIGQPYVNPNGLASVFMRSDNAQNVKLNSLHCYIPYGNALMAADSLVDTISRAVGAEPLFKQRY